MPKFYSGDAEVRKILTSFFCGAVCSMVACSNPLGSGGGKVSSGSYKSIVAGSGTRTWSDGSFASSCLGYLSPPDGYSYSGAVGDGIYRINPSGATLDVYCDMTTDGGGWTLNYDSSVALHLNTFTSQFISQTISSGAREVMTYYATSTTGYPAATTKYKFNKPAGFDLFTVLTATVSTTVTNLSNQTTSTSSSVEYGSNDFATLACDAWAGPSYGRFCLCIGGGDAANFNSFPFYNGYSSASGDFCSLSSQGYSTTSCTAAYFIVLFER